MMRVTCGHCGFAIDPAEHPSICPECGGADRLIESADTGTIESHDLIKLKKKRPGKKKPYEELKVGEDLHRDTGTWSKLDRRIDRENDRYQEHIENAEGRVVRHVDEPLSEHQGHGSAKKRAKEPGG